MFQLVNRLFKVMQPKPLSTYKRILVLGDSGRGKTTFANLLSKKLNIPHYSTDDFFWKVKFTEVNDRAQSVIEINKVYHSDEWVVDGTTRRLLNAGLEKSDAIFYLRYKSIIPQYYFIIKRKFRRKHESFSDLWGLLKHVTYKRYKKGYGNYSEPLDVLLKPYMNKTITFDSMRDIRKYSDSI